MNDDRIELDPSIYLVTGNTACWRCGAPMPVVAILCENPDCPDEGPYLLFNTVELPEEVVAFVQRRCPTYRLTYSKTVGGKYYANNCPKCGIIFGDFYLFSEPGTPFFPTNVRKAATLTIEPIPIQKRYLARAGRGYGTGDLILNHAKRRVRAPTPNADHP